jgi:hypothetical protein
MSKAGLIYLLLCLTSCAALSAQMQSGGVTAKDGNENIRVSIENGACVCECRRCLAPLNDYNKLTIEGNYGISKVHTE